MNFIPTVRHYRTIWISDIHLGTRGCKAEFLLDFLRHTESETLYLVGDIVDGWRLSRSWYWAQSHNDVIQKLLRKVRKGTRVVYIPGNHDEWLRDYLELQMGGILVQGEAIHETADNRRFLVIHGDMFDGVVRYAPWLALLGDWAYRVMMRVSNGLNMIRRMFGYRYWSLSAYLKGRVKNAVEYTSNFEGAVAAEAKKRGVDGVICGHIHKAAITRFGEVIYCNDGDWVESCTALVEHFDGRIEILDWMAERGADPFSIGLKGDAPLDAEETAIP